LIASFSIFGLCLGENSENFSKKAKNKLQGAKLQAGKKFSQHCSTY